MANIVVLGKFEAAPEGSLVVDTTSKGGVWAGLSPFTLGPCPLYGGRSSLNMENAWQFAKVYKQHATPSGEPTAAYWEWAEKGWADRWAHRYPMGKGAVPLYSLWDGERLSYVEARRSTPRQWSRVGLFWSCLPSVVHTMGRWSLEISTAMTTTVWASRYPRCSTTQSARWAMNSSLRLF